MPQHTMTNPNKPSAQLALWSVGLLLLILITMQAAQSLIPRQGYVLGGFDVETLFYPWMTYARSELLAGRVPLWDMYQFAGYPFLANPQVALFYPPMWLIVLAPDSLGFSLFVAAHQWLSGVGMLMLVYTLSRTTLGAGLAAITYAFSGYMMARIFAGHIGVIAAMTWLPWLLFLTRWAIRRGDVLSGILTGLPFALSILSGHTTSLIYISIVWAGFVIYLLCIREASWQLIIRQMTLAASIGIALSAIQLLPLFQLIRFSARSFSLDAAFSQSLAMHGDQFLALLMPKVYGYPVGVGLFWRSSLWKEMEFIYYAGIMPILGIGLIIKKIRPLTVYYLALITFGLLLSMWVIYRPIATLIPLFTIERVPARAAFLYVFGMSALLGEALAVAQTHRESRSTLLILLSGLLVISGAGIITNMTLLSEAPEEYVGRINFVLTGWLFALGVTLLGGLLLFVYTRGYQRILVGGALAILVFFDLGSYGHGMLAHQSRVQLNATWTDAQNIVGETEQRAVITPVLDRTWDSNHMGQMGIRMITGYNTLQLAANKHLVESSNGDLASPVFNIYGVEYVIASAPLEKIPAIALVSHTDAVWVYRRAHVLEVARLVYHYEVIPSPDVAVARLSSSGYDPSKSVILDAAPECDLTSEDAAGVAQIQSHQPQRWVISTRSDAPALLVLNETAYPGWQVTVDGTPAVPLTAYTAIRAVCVPAGTHEVIWSYYPRVFIIGGSISTLALVVVLIAIIALWRQSTLSRQAPKVIYDEQN